MMKFSSGGVMAAGAVGLLTVAVVLSRNAFLMTNIMEMVHRCQHAIVGDRYENIRALVDFEPWFGKKDGVAVVTGSNSGLVRSRKELDDCLMPNTSCQSVV